MNVWRTWMSGLGLLRYPELVRDLGERRFHLQQVGQINKQYPSAKVDRDIILVGFQPEYLNLSERCTLSKGTVLAFGDESNGYGRIEVGKNTWVGQYNNLRAGGGDVVIGNHCLVSQFCTLVASNHLLDRSQLIQSQKPDSKRIGVVLEDDVWLGAGVNVLPDVTIHEGAVIAASAVIIQDVPAYEIWAGVPARKVGER